MEFARKQLEKYGWTDGKGLGKNETGITKAIKPKLKRSATGVGYDPAKDFTEHWWSELYNKAVSNVQVEEEEGATKKIKRKDDDFEITNSTWQMKHKKHENSEQGYSDFFVKREVLDKDKVKVEKLDDSSDESDDGVKMTDEELFAACGGRTAHKGARHGLRALGKLARVEMQEKLLLQESRFNGYSHKKSKDETQVVEDTLLNSDQEDTKNKNKKKKKKRCYSLNLDNNKLDNNNSTVVAEDDEANKKSKKMKKDQVKEDDVDDICVNNLIVDNASVTSNEGLSKKKLKKKKKHKYDTKIVKGVLMDVEENEELEHGNECKEEENSFVSNDNIDNDFIKNAKGKKYNSEMPSDLKVTLEIDQIPEKICKKFKKKLKTGA